MTPIKCKECGSNTNPKNRTCTNCGTRIRRKTGLTGWLIASLYAGLGYLLLSNSVATPEPATPSSTSNTTTAPEPNSAEVQKKIALDGLQIKNLRWRKGGFDSVMLIDITIANGGHNAVKDLTLECSLYGNSGTRIYSTSKVVYEVIPAGKSKALKNFNMGLIQSQASGADCTVSDLTFECSSASPCRL